MHFDEALSARSRGVDSTKLVTKSLRGKSASEKLSEEGLVKFSSRVAMQVMTNIEGLIYDGMFTCVDEENCLHILRNGNSV